jgi:hypothetical protein
MNQDKEQKLSTELTPEQVAEETKGVDTSLPEDAATHRRPLSSARQRGGAEHRSGEEQEGEEPPPHQIPTPKDPPRQYTPPKGA